MEGDFTLNKLGWYEVQSVAENDFLNGKLENDTYGIWYSVKFMGDADTHLWQAKSAPKEGERVYGHLEKTASGKSTKFRRAKKDETPSSPAPTGSGRQVPHDNSQQESIARSVALKAAVDMGIKVPKEVLYVADQFLAWLTNSGSQGGTISQATNVAQNPMPAATAGSGYQRARAQAESIKRRYDEDDEAVQRYQDSAEPPFDPNDIPPEYR